MTCEQRTLRAAQQFNPPTVVDGNLFALSHEKKWIGLLLLPLFFKLVGSSGGVRTLFDGNCWKCLVNNLSNQANYLHAAAKTALEACVEHTRYVMPSLPRA